LFHFTLSFGIFQKIRIVNVSINLYYEPYFMTIKIDNVIQDRNLPMKFYSQRLLSDIFPYHSLRRSHILAKFPCHKLEVLIIWDYFVGHIIKINKNPRKFQFKQISGEKLSSWSDY